MSHSHFAYVVNDGEKWLLAFDSAGDLARFSDARKNDRPVAVKKDAIPVRYLQGLMYSGYRKIDFRSQVQFDSVRVL